MASGLHYPLPQKMAAQFQADELPADPARATTMAARSCRLEQNTDRVYFGYRDRLPGAVAVVNRRRQSGVIANHLRVIGRI
jgi:hypothetical protein